MIALTRRNGTCFALNPDLIERVEATPDTVITLVAGTRYIVTETVEQVVQEVREFRAAVLSAADMTRPPTDRRAGLHAVPDADQ
jgi:flagellar protein FlbD